MERELAESKRKLESLVDEVLYLESELGGKGRQVGFLLQALADSTAAHAAALASVEQQGVVLASGARGAGLVKAATLAAENAMADLREFQQDLQRALVQAGQQLPPPSFAPSAAGLDATQRQQVAQLRKMLEREGLATLPSASAASPRNTSSTRHAAKSEQAERKLEARVRQQQARIASLEAELQQAKNAQVWPFRDDHRSHEDHFGMSSNSTGANSRLAQLGAAQAATLEQKDAGFNDDEDSPQRLRAEVERLKGLLEDQERQHDNQRKAMMRQTETELQDAESQILQLRQELNQSHAAAAAASAATSPHGSRPRFRVSRVRISKSGDVDLGVDPRDSESAEPALRALQYHESPVGGGEQAKATLERLAALEQEVARERSEKEQLRRQLHAASRASRDSTSALEQLELEHGIGREAFETERGQTRAVRNELEKALRDREVALRECKAAERRHEAVMEEMKEVLEERDRAVSASQATNRKYLVRVQELEKAQVDLDAARAAQRAAEEATAKAERDTLKLKRSLEAEKSSRGSVDQDLAILRQQIETITMERDAAIREQQAAMSRVDDAMRERKAALEARDRALHSVQDLQDQASQATVKVHKSETRARELEAEVGRLSSQLGEARQRASEADRELSSMRTLVERAEDDKTSAEQEMEVAQRQCRALGEELKSVLRVRDIALKQRDTALQQQQQQQGQQLQLEGRLMGPGDQDRLEHDDSRGDANGQHQLGAAPERKPRDQDAAEQCKVLWAKVDELEVSMAALEEEKGELQARLDASGYLGLNPDTASLVKDKLVAVSRAAADVQQSVRAATLTLNHDLGGGRDAHAEPLRALQDSAVGTATKSDGLQVILATLAKQVQAMDLDADRCVKAVHRRLGTGGVPSSVSGTRQSPSASEALKNANDKLRDELDFVHSELKSCRLNLAEVEAERDRALSRVRFLEEQLEAAAGVRETGARSEALQARVSELEKALEDSTRAQHSSARRMQNELEEERLQLKDALERLRASDDKVLELKRKLRSNLFEIERLELERDKLAAHVENASSQLRGVASQKTHAAKELEEVYSSLTDLEKQLLASHAENTRLKRVLATYGGGSATLRDGRRSADSTPPITPDDASIGPRNVRIKRTGSIVID